MDFDKLFLITEKLQSQTIGEPIWMTEKGTFEYARQCVEVVVVLKVIRATQGIKSLHLLCDKGLFIDMGAIFRCVNDCSSEVYFLLEEYPKSSEHVNQFVKAFFETISDGYLETTTEQVSTKKIHSAMVRVLTGREQDEESRKRILRIHKTFSGYVHANYAHILHIYGGTPSKFNLAGVPSIREIGNHMQLVEEAYFSVLYTIRFIAQKFNLTNLYHEIVQCC